MKNSEEVKIYREEIISKFLVKMLELESSVAEKDSKLMTESLSEESLAKLSHFFDCILQCTEGVTTKTCSESASCGSCCGKCDCKK